MDFLSNRKQMLSSNTLGTIELYFVILNCKSIIKVFITCYYIGGPAKIGKIMAYYADKL